MARTPANPTAAAYALPASRETAKDRAHPYSIVRPGVKAGDEWSVKDICAAYDWPDEKQVSGGGKIALIHLAGGWLQTDINKFFVDQVLPGFAPKPTDRSLNSDFTNTKLPPLNEADAEVALDIQLAGADCHASSLLKRRNSTWRTQWRSLVARSSC